MGQYTSYWLYQKYEKRGSQEAIPVYPNVYSVDADGTMSKVIKIENDSACGYVPTGTTQYRWVNLDPSVDYYCDECPPAPQYRWVESGTTCVGYDKYQRAIKQVSYDNGQTWENVSPAEYSATTLIQADSPDCGYVEPIYRWIKSDDTICVEATAQYRTISGTPYCTGYDKYVDVYSQVSYDSGSTWTTTATTPTLVEADSEDCGYEPAPTGVKYRATYIGGEVYNLSCFGEHGTLTSGNTYHSGYFSSAVTTAQIGDCVTAIGTSAFAGFGSLSRLNSIIDGVGIIPSGVTSIDDGAFACCRSLTAITIPSGVTSIGEVAFNDCYNLTSINIPSGVTSIANYTFSSCYNLTGITIPNGVTTIGNRAFWECSSLASITCLATTPPTLGNNVFYNTNNCPIYVPASSVEAYQTAWSDYASRIQAIP